MGNLKYKKALHAFTKKNTLEGQKLIKEAVFTDRSFLDEQAKKFIELVINLGSTSGEDIERFVSKIFSQLPSGLMWITQYQEQVLAGTYRMRGIDNIFSGLDDHAELNIKKFASHNVQLNQKDLLPILSKIQDYEETYGPENTRFVIHLIADKLKKVGFRSQANWLIATYFVNHAFTDFINNRLERVIPDVITAISFRPELLLNRGVLSISLRSIQRK